MKLSHVIAGAALALGVGFAASGASAASLVVTSYSTPNGDGQASGGEFNYWDRNYTGSGSTTTDHSPLSGGLGALTDGYVSPDPWYNVSNTAGTGPYVGWEFQINGEPTIVFNFAGASTVNTVSVAVDNTGVGGVSAPATLTINGVNYTPTATPISSTSEWLTVSGLSLTGSSLTLTPNDNPNAWTFISEVSFGGVAGVPEPGTWAMMLVGFGGLGALLRSRRKLASANA
jgi:hypothetical protein